MEQDRLIKELDKVSADIAASRQRIRPFITTEEKSKLKQITHEPNIYLQYADVQFLINLSNKLLKAVDTLEELQADYAFEIIRANLGFDRTKLGRIPHERIR
jgi:hypothetical protein